jgi:alpha-galactosidase
MVVSGVASAPRVTRAFSQRAAGSSTFLVERWRSPADGRGTLGDSQLGFNNGNPAEPNKEIAQKVTSSLIHLTAPHASVVIDPSTGVPSVLHWGDVIDGPIHDDSVRAALQQPIVHGGLDVVAPLTLLPEHGSGFGGRPGLEGFRADGAGWAPRFTLQSVETGSDAERMWAYVTSVDEHEGLQLLSEFELRLASSVLRTRVTVNNVAATPYTLLAVRQTLPIPTSAQEVMTFGGRWSKEFIEVRQLIVTGSVVVENRTGRTSHNRVPIAFAGSAAFSNESGVVRGVHLEWSGNSFVAVDVLTDGRRCMQAAELLLPGEIVLEPSGGSYQSPWAAWAFSDRGTNGTSARFHTELRSRPNHPKSDRPVTLNIWEAVYFDHEFERLASLAEVAASIGVERFVVDDGWFHLRRNDKAGLGDWWVDPAVWPTGLSPIADKVVGLGMQFGLWFEPEMVNPDSDLYRAHPEWVLVDHRYEPVMGRQQLVLDLGRVEVRDYLFKRISALLNEYPISYVKWDHNRELVHASHEGRRAGVHLQTYGYYELLARLRSAHPAVEIESCSSGGGRIDFKVLEYCHRFWTSDCIDPLERQHMQNGFTHVFPPEYMGSHVSSDQSHTTRRKHSLSFRAATALFGHFGIEWNVLDASDEDRAALADVIAIHKRHRALLHSGEVRRFDHGNPAVLAHGVIATDQSEALVAFSTIAASSSLMIEPFHISGLRPNQMYKVDVVAIGGGTTGAARVQPNWFTAGSVSLSGRELELFGLQPPALDPEQSLVLHVSAV